ncbi:MAG: AraC family transcriptional regulator [Spirochaetes bacterium]|nr:AraC family transcriptional regulator [Spirochaetota bacterium]
MNFQEVYYNNNNLNLELDILFSGREKCLPEHKYRGVRNHYLVHYITDGYGRIKMDNKMYRLEKGDAFFVFPDQKNFYQASKNHPWSYKWIGFSGSRADEILNSIHINRKSMIIHNVYISAIENMIDQVFENLKNRNPGYELKIKGLFYIILSKFVEQNEIRAKNNSYQKVDYIENILEFIQNNYQRSITVNQMSQYLGINRSYFSNLFKKRIGTSVQDYLIKYRIDKAKELLITSEYSVAEISHFVGYKEYFTFYKIFKKLTGLSPKQYKNLNKKVNVIYYKDKEK